MNGKKYNSVLVVDDHKMIVNGIRLLAGRSFQHFYAAHDGASAISHVLRHRPELVILDYTLPDTTGDWVAETIRHKAPGTRILTYTFNYNEEAVRKMFFAGVNGYVVKGENDDEFLTAISIVMEGREYFCQEARSQIINRLSPSEERTRYLVSNTSFSQKEIEVIRLICQQKTAREISARMELSERTIEQYRSNIIRRMGEKSIIGILKFALKNGIVRLEDI